MIPPVGVGPSTLAGLLTAITGFAGALIAYVVKSPGDQQQLGTIVSAGVGMVALVVVMIGRYAQSTSKIKAQAAVPLDETALAKHVAAYLGTVLQQPAPAEEVQLPAPAITPVNI